MNWISNVKHIEHCRARNGIQGSLETEELLRLTELDNYQILDTGTDPRFEHVAKLAGRLLKADYVLITLADKDRQWWKANVNLPSTIIPPGLSFSRQAIKTRNVFCVHDAKQHPIYQNNPFVQGEPYVRAYLGAPLMSAKGFALGALSTFFRNRYEPTDYDKQTLQDLAKIVVDELELHRQTCETSCAKELVARSEEEFRTTFEGAAIGMAHIGIDGNFIKANEQLCKILGYSATELIGLNFREITHHEHLAKDEQAILSLLSHQTDACHIEKRYVTKAGKELWCALSVAIRWDHSGHPLYFIATLQDISARKRAESRTELLIGELNHRIKNTIATVASVANQTARASATIDSFRDNFGDRVAAVSAAHSLLNANKWDWVNLSDLIEEQAKLGASGNVSRIEANGPRVKVASQVTLYLGLILHELATNARKHGALSVDCGSVEIAWESETRQGVKHLQLQWREIGAVRFDGTMAQAGFGGFLINKGLRMGLQGTSKYTALDNGFLFELEIPLVERPKDTRIA